MKHEILRTIVGSHAHGLATETSDIDYRSVYALPTAEILSLGFNYKGSSWVEGESEDNTAYEIGHFLMLATKNNPSILEVMVAPVESQSNYGDELRALLPSVFDPQQAFNSFTGYSLNQRKKMLDNHLGRKRKFATAYIRTLYNLYDLLLTGTFRLKVTDKKRLVILKQLKYADFHNGFVIDLADELTEQAKTLLNTKYFDKNGEYLGNPLYNKDRANEFLLKIRKVYL
jgi:predicted nucleotidyltransferase